jgi:hypothetical protein
LNRPNQILSAVPRRLGRRRRSIAFLPAFTLIEMLAAMSLATLLMVAAMPVLRSLRPSSMPADLSLSSNVLGLLRWDLANSRRFQPHADGVTLWGLGSLDAGSMQPTDRPAMVTYRVAIFAGVSSLIRIEEPLGASAGPQIRSQLICSNVSAFSVRGLADSPGSGDDQPFDRNPGRPLPRRVEVTLTRSNGGQIQTIVCLR